MEEEDRDDGLELPEPVLGLEHSRDAAKIIDAGAAGVRLGLLDRSGRQVDSNHLPGVLRKQQFGVGNSASDAEHTRLFTDVCNLDDPLDQVLAHGANGWFCEMCLREAGVELFVILEFAIEVGGHLSYHTRKTSLPLLMPFDILKTGLDPPCVHWFRSIDSTMHEAVRLAQAGAASGTIVGADEQTGGIGRQGHTWHSQKDAGLYVSFILRIPVAAADVPVVTLALGLAAAEAIAKTAGVACDLRWPNDVLINGRKCCGILTQLHTPAIVAGVGINVNHSDFPDDISPVATSLRVATGREQSREVLLGNLWTAVETFTGILVNDGKDVLLRLFENASSYVRGRRVTVDNAIVGTTAGLDANGFLILKKDDGADMLILAGGVRPLED
jgi:BirA family biotin operon repressor/biotin-[acetyl-CoA-carboxylase] ligase